MNQLLSRGAQIIVDQWLSVEAGESLLIVTNESHVGEMDIIKGYAEHKQVTVEIMTFADSSKQVSHYFDVHEKAFDAYDVILGATTHSLVTTCAVKRAVQRGSRFLSLPLSTNGEASLLEYDFLLMDPMKSVAMAKGLIAKLNQAKEVTIKTDLGTNLTFGKAGRDARFFTGSTKAGNGYASSSFEVFIPIEETKTNGIGYVDASFGYLGTSKEAVAIGLQDGRIVEIEQNTMGRKLKEYIDHFEDDRMVIAGELGIGLNEYATCSGNSYIEDESAYGTFHIGFGRNIALGGVQEARGHFDLVFHEPDIYADSELIMYHGKIIPELMGEKAI